MARREGKMDTTVIYYTANTENEVFEKKIRDVIFKNSGGLPIISVSRKPIDFGENICIGEQPVNYANLNRQLLVGLKAAKTKFCMAAESDTLYPPEYFRFTPSIEDHVFSYSNIYVIYTWPSKRYYGVFWKKPITCAARICGRDLWIKAIERLLDPDDWFGPVDDGPVFPEVIEDGYAWYSESAVITFKTRNNLSKYTSYFKRPKLELPYWGTSEDILKQYGENNGNAELHS